MSIPVDQNPILSRQDRLDATALLILRLGLAWFIFLWAIHKIITPGQYQFLARHFDDVDMSVMQVYAMGGFQIVLCLCAAFGIFRIFSYSGLAIMHFFTILRRWERFLDPFAVNDRGFPVNRNPVIDLAVMAAFLALILLIRRDHFSLGAWISRHNRPRWWL